MSPQKTSKKSKFATKSAIAKYRKLIEDFLKIENKPYSELQIAERLFDIHIRKEGNIPSSAEELLKLSCIKDALKILTKERTVIGSLIEDPITKEQVMCYSASGRYPSPEV